MADGDLTALAERIERLGRRATGTLTASDEAREALAKARAALQAIKDGDGDGLVNDGTPQEGPAPGKPAQAATGQIKIHPAVAKALGPAGAAHLQALIDAKAPSPAIMAALRPAAQEAADIPPTLGEGEMPTPEFWAKRTYEGGKKLPETVDSLVETAKAYAGKGGVLTEKKAVLVVGAPAAGKSTFAERMAAENHAAIWDADDAKKVIPEYADGIGASAVHEESKAITAMVGARLLDEGDNIIHPIVGHDINKAKALIDKLRGRGYEVDVVHVFVQPDEALRRMASRYVSTGRLIDPDYFREVADKPGRVYSFLRDHGVLKDGYAEIDANGAKGQAHVREAVDAPRGVEEEQPLQRQGGGQPARVADAMPGRRHLHLGAGHGVAKGKGFDPNEPRDKDGKWTGGVGGVWLKHLFPGKSALYAPPKYTGTPQYGGFWGGASDHQAAADLHPAKDDKGNEVWIGHPHHASPDTTWNDPEAVATFTPGQKSMPAELNGVPLKPWTPPDTKEGWNHVEGQDPGLDELEPMPAPPPVPEGVKPLHAAAGVVILEDDGRVWLCSPTNGYGGYRNTFPKGTIEPEITSPQANAIKEAYEETGLKVEITGVLGDFKRTQSQARYYLARRTGGTPKAMGWESQAVRLAPVHELRKLLNNGTVDHPIVQALENYFGGFVQKAFNPNQPRWPKGTPLGGKWMGVGESGLTLPPHIGWNKENTGPGANPKYYKKAQALHAAAEAGDWKTVQDYAADGQEAIDKFQSGSMTSTHDKWKAQVAQYAQHLVENNAQKVSVQAVAENASGIPNISDWKKVGEKPGGSNPGGIYEDQNGTKWLVKGNSKGANDERARNEVLAAKLMAAAGIPAPEIKLVDLNGKDGLPVHNGGLGVAVRYIATLEPISNKGWAKGQVQDQFAVHAWLGNYDVIGTGTAPGGSDNMMFAPHSYKVINIDPGGAILYRAQGAKKTDFGDSATTWDTMRDPKYPHAHAFFGDMTASQLAQSAQHVEAVTPETINALVKSAGLPESVAWTLKARRADVLKRSGLWDAPTPAKPSPTGPETGFSPVGEHVVSNAKSLEKPTLDGDAWTGAQGWLDQIEKMHAAGDVAGLKALGMMGGVDYKGDPINHQGGQYSSMFGPNVSLTGGGTGATIVGYQKAAIADLEKNPVFESEHPRGEGGKFTDKPGGEEHPWPDHLKPPSFGGAASPYYQGLIDQAAEHYTGGDYAALEGMKTKFNKSGMAYPAWPENTVNGKAMTAWHQALLADVKASSGDAFAAEETPPTSLTISGWKAKIATAAGDPEAMKAVLSEVAKDPHMPPLALKQLVDHAMEVAAKPMTSAEVAAKSPAFFSALSKAVGDGNFAYAKDVIAAHTTPGSPMEAWGKAIIAEAGAPKPAPTTPGTKVEALNAAYLATGVVPSDAAVKHAYPYTSSAFMDELKGNLPKAKMTASDWKLIGGHDALAAWGEKKLADLSASPASKAVAIEWKDGVPVKPSPVGGNAANLDALENGIGVNGFAKDAASDIAAQWHAMAGWEDAGLQQAAAYAKALARYHKGQTGDSTPLIVSTGDAGALDHLVTPKAVSGAEPDWEKAYSTAQSGGNKSHNPKVDTIKSLYEAGDYKGILNLNYATNTYGKKQAKVANDALAALGYGDYKVVPGQGKGEHPGTPGLFNPTGEAGGAFQPATAESIQAMGKGGKWLRLKPGEKVVEEGEQFGVKWAKIEVPAKGFDPTGIPKPPDFFTNGTQGATGKWKSSVQHVNEANNAAVNALYNAAITGKSAAAIDAVTFPAVSKDTGQPTGETISLAKHPAAAVKEYADELKAELKAQTASTYKTVQSGSFSGAYSDIAASLAAVYKPQAYPAFAGWSKKAADYLVLSNDAAAAIPTPTLGQFKEVSPQQSAFGGFMKESQNFIANMPGSLSSKLKSYTNSSYDAWNEALRKGAVDSANFASVKPLADYMAKNAPEIPEGTILWRGIGVGESTFKSVNGSIIQDGSLQSTSHGDKPAFSGNDTWLRLHIGKGVRGVSVVGFSNHSERETILAPNTRYAILDVSKPGGKYGHKTIVDMLVLPHMSA